MLCGLSCFVFDYGLVAQLVVASPGREVLPLKFMGSNFLEATMLHVENSVGNFIGSENNKATISGSDEEDEDVSADLLSFAHLEAVLDQKSGNRKNLLSNMRGKTVAITGANSGVGLHAAIWIAGWGQARKVILACRSAQKCKNYTITRA